MSLGYVADCPLLAQDDVVRLHNSVRHANATLTDGITGITHVFHHIAQPTLTALSHGTTVAQLYECRTLQPTQITELLGFCNVVGALEIYRSRSSRAKLLLTYWQNFFMGITHASHTRRYQANLPGICMSVVRACQTLIVASVVVGGLAGIAVQSKVSTIITVCLWCLLTFVGSIIAHEYGHVRALQRSGVATVVLQRKSNIRLLHAKASNETVVALAGSISGCIFVAICWLGFSLMQVAYITPIAACIVLTHCLSLTPFYADGKSLPYYQRLSGWRSS